MRNLKVTFVALLTVLTATVYAAGSASDSASLFVTALNANSKFNLIYVKDASNLIKVKIHDAEGRLIFTDLIKTSKSFIKPYSLTELPEGKYTVTIQDNEKLFTQELDNSAKALAKSDVKVDLVADAETNKVKLTVTGSDISALDVDILTSDSNLIYTDVINADKSFTRTYDFSKIQVKDVFFTVKSEGQVLENSLLTVR